MSIYGYVMQCDTCTVYTYMKSNQHSRAIDKGNWYFLWDAKGDVHQPKLGISPSDIGNFSQGK